MNKLLLMKHLQSIIFCQRQNFDITLNLKKHFYSMSIGSDVCNNVKILSNYFFMKVPVKCYCDNSEIKSISKSSLELWNQMKKKPEVIENPKLIKVAIVGTPNSGKSTLINALCAIPICPTSCRVHTTTHNARALMNVENVQVVFVDTPGAVFAKEAKKYKLNHSQLVDPMSAVLDADLIVVLHDVSTAKSHSRVLSRRVIKLLVSNPLTPSILLLNKMDQLQRVEDLTDYVLNLTDGVVGGQNISGVAIPEKKSDDNIRESVLESFLESVKTVKKEQPVSPSENSADWDREQVFKGNIKLNEMQAATFARRLDSWPLFESVYSISALHSWHLDVVKQDIISRAYSHPWIFPSNVITDQVPEKLAVNVIRGVCLQLMDPAIPYFLQFNILQWEVKNEDLIQIKAELIFHKALLVKRFHVRYEEIIVNEVQNQLRTIFNCNICLYLEARYVAKKT